MKKVAFFWIFYLFIGYLSAQATLPFEDDFESGVLNANWWTPLPDIMGINGVIQIDAGVGINNSNGLKIGKSDDYSGFTTNALDLHLNLSNQTNVEMTFWIADWYDETDTDDGIYFSDDGGSTFVKVLNFKPSEWCDNTYGQHPPLDVDKLASEAGLNLTSQFVIRFQQRGENDFTGAYFASGDGFYLDNVKVYDPGLTYATLPFEDDFNTGVFKDSWAWNFADQTSTVASDFGITSPMSKVAIEDGVGVDNTNGVAIGRRCDGAFTTNALDLHLNLSNQTNVEMTFWIADWYDETDTDDGIYFSDDGGSTFVKVLDFNFSSTIDNLYEQYQVDISNLAMLSSLELTDQFVIRFQQRGENDFTGAYFASGDGFYLDDISVIGMATSTLFSFEGDGIQVYPVPSEDQVNISLTKLSNQIENIELYNSLGVRLYEKEVVTQKLHQVVDISMFPIGIYYLSIKFKGGRQVTKKIVKK